MIGQEAKLDLRKLIIIYSKRPEPIPKHYQKFEPVKSHEEKPLTRADLDLCIVLREGVRSCTKQPISNFMIYSQVSASFKASVVVVDGVNVSRNVQEALKDPKLNVVVHKEMRALIDNDTWNVVNLPENKKTVGCK